MFDKKDIEQYQSIVVPSGLCGRIERDYAQKQSKPRVIGGSRLSRLALPMAACLILLCTVFLNLPNDADMLLYNGTPVTEQRVLLGNDLARSVAEPFSSDERAGIPLTIEEKDEYFVTASSGSIYSENGEVLLADAGTEKKLEGKNALLWSLDTGEKATLSVRIGKKTYEYVFEYDENAGGYVLYQK